MSELLDPKKNIVVLGKLAVIVFVFLCTIFVIYQFSSQEVKDSINELGLGKQVIPWEDRADSIVRKLIDSNRADIASSVQSITHPSGNEPSLGDVRVSKLDGQLLVEIDVHWRGGILGTEYKTEVLWEFSQTKHGSAKVIFEDAPIGVSPSNAEQLNDYFRVKIYPVLYQDIDN